ncbi:glycerophosphodiester phosphodiesterase family protein [Butyrivibrio sp. JL13D10]|uniref:glycerophosphodiester phosphodiesterase family protein n=1 Tax=Butyrivibrio sp. JL13D10 TaxID=3236815 RepID=UPI0038B5C8B5
MKLKFSKNFSKLISFFIIASICSSFLTGCASDNEQKNKIANMRNLFSEEKFIIHACGEIADESGTIYDYTNSKEALENSYANGNRIIEVDFHYTSDHVLVCGHAWGDLYLDGKQMTPGEAPTYDEFMKCKVMDKFTALTFDDIAEFMKKNEDLVIVTDTKETDIDTYKTIAKKYPELTDRFVVQIYHASEYDDVKKAGFPLIIYTLYEATENELTKNSLLKAAKKNLVGFTYHIDLLDNPAFEDIMKQTDTPKYIHTVNSNEDIQRCFDSGAVAVYTDRTDLMFQ